MVFGWFKKDKEKPAAPASIYSALRSKILQLRPDEIGLNKSNELPNVWGVLVETGYPEAVVTLVSLADRTTSLYFSTGGGILGAGRHPPVATATRSLISDSEKFLGKMSPVAECPLPAKGMVRFYLPTFSGVFSAEAGEQAIRSDRHELSPFFQRTHEVIGQVRIYSEKKEPGEGTR